MAEELHSGGHVESGPWGHGLQQGHQLGAAITRCKLTWARVALMTVARNGCVLDAILKEPAGFVHRLAGGERGGEGGMSHFRKTEVAVTGPRETRSGVLDLVSVSSQVIIIQRRCQGSRQIYRPGGKPGQPAAWS